MLENSYKFFTTLPPCDLLFLILVNEEMIVSLNIPRGVFFLIILWTRIVRLISKMKELRPRTPKWWTSAQKERKRHRENKKPCLTTPTSSGLSPRPFPQASKLGSSPHRRPPYSRAPGQGWPGRLGPAGTDCLCPTSPGLTQTWKGKWRCPTEPNRAPARDSEEAPQVQTQVGNPAAPKPSLLFP